LAVCSKCGGDVREGEAFVQVTSTGSLVGASSSGFGVIPMPAFDMPTGERTSENTVLWREKTGAKTGRFIKSDEQLTMKVSGRRCIKCGYIELYAQQ